MAEPERRRRRPTTACLVCRRRKTRCDRETPCSNCVRSRRKEACIYEDESPRPRQRTPPVRPTQSVVQASPIPVYADEVLPRYRNALSQSHSGSSAGATSTPASTVVTQATSSSSKLIEAMRMRIRQLEAQLYKVSPGSIEKSSAKPDTNIETTETKLSDTFHVHRGDRGVLDQAVLVSRSISHKTRFFGQSHWINSFILIVRDMVEMIEPYFRDENSQALAHMHRCKVLARAIKAQRAPSWPCPLTLDLPTRELADVLVDRYLQTTETVYRIVHIPTFKDQYKSLWDTAGAKRDRSFIVQLKLILALGAVSYDDNFTLRRQAVRWIYEAQTFLSEPIFKPRLRIHILQAQILLVLAKELVDISGDSNWISAGSLIRTAITMGLHRDPLHLPKMEPLAVEMRRRLWSTILEISLQASMAKGCPPLISIQDFDTQSPLDLEDEDIVADPADIGLGKPSNGFTQVSIANALRQTFPVRLKVTKFLNDLDSGIGTYEEALKLDTEVRLVFKELRQRLRACIPDENLSSSLRRPSFAVQAVESIMHRYLSSLHMPFFGASLHESAYAFSRKVVVDTSLKIWCAAWPPSCINPASLSTAVPPEDDLFFRLVRNGSGFFRTVAAQAAFVIPAELRAQLQEGLGLGPTPLRQDLLSVTEEAKTWCLRCIEAGETSAKGYLMASMMAAQVEGQRKGLNRDQLGRFLVETVERSGEICLPVLEDLEKRSRPEDTRQDLDATGTGEGEILPGLTEDWNFTMPDVIFTDIDGAMDWSFGGVTMQGLCL